MYIVYVEMKCQKIKNKTKQKQLIIRLVHGKLDNKTNKQKKTHTHKKQITY